MFKKENENRDETKEVETIIGSSVKVKGNFNSQGNIVIEGVVEGSIKTSGNVYIESNARVVASIEAQEGKIAGEVKGNIKIKGYLEIAETAKIFGDIECAVISIEQGAILNSKCSMATEELTNSSKKEN